jgi:hypothetical protein
MSRIQNNKGSGAHPRTKVCVECGNRFQHTLKPMLTEKFCMEMFGRPPLPPDKIRGWSPCCRAEWKLYVKESTLIRKRFEESDRS